MEHIKRNVSKLVDEVEGKQDSPFAKIIPALMKKGLENANLSMFTEEKKKELLNAAGEEYVKRNQVMDAIRTFKMTDNKQRLMEIGDEHAKVGLFQQAIEAELA